MSGIPELKFGTQEEAVTTAKALGKKGFELANDGMLSARATFDKVKEAGFFDHYKEFGRDLYLPFGKEWAAMGGQEGIKAEVESIVYVKPADTNQAFIACNAATFYFEIVASFFFALFTFDLMYFFLHVIFSAAVAYLLYWLVVHSNSVKYINTAMMLFVGYGLLNLLSAWLTLIMVIPGVLYFVKAAMSFYCAFYANKIRENVQGAMQIAGGEAA